MDNKWTLHTGMPFHSGALACANVSKLQRGLAKYLIWWFLLLEGIVCSRHILQRVVECDKEVNGIGNGRGNHGPHIRVQGYLKEGNPTPRYLMYKREKSWYMRFPEIDFYTLIYMYFSFYDFSLIKFLGLKG